MLAGDKIALAKLMTLVENRRPDTALVMSLVHDRCGRAYTIGITGPPGAGKSTLVDRTVGELRSAGHRVGIVAIDPSSPFSGGAVLGDRIRMQSHFLDEGVFIRSLSSRGSHGGMARATRDVARLLDAYGMDFVVVETVGVGQTELDIMRMADTTVVVLVPEAGDTVQAMKAGLLEIADIFLVNKADREGAQRMKTELEMMLQLRPAAAWSVPVLLTQATTGQGIAELTAQINRHREFLAHSGRGQARAVAGRQEEFVAVLREEIARRLEAVLDDGRFGSLLLRIKHGEIDPYRAALEVVGSEEAVRAILQSRGEG
ncbi:MAG: methylmalonyl Co-A mutase-associated GTPase MeaB [Deltaproteobacteria bacterium]|nr:methylmalonyl Co-A mutase-associated GTPase MeaB [Deltaproteobacteria bacterium]